MARRHRSSSPHRDDEALGDIYDEVPAWQDKDAEEAIDATLCAPRGRGASRTAGGREKLQWWEKTPTSAGRPSPPQGGREEGVKRSRRDGSAASSSSPARRSYPDMSEPSECSASSRNAAWTLDLTRLVPRTTASRRGRLEGTRPAARAESTTSSPPRSIDFDAERPPEAAASPDAASPDAALTSMASTSVASTVNLARLESKVDAVLAAMAGWSSHGAHANREAESPASWTKPAKLEEMIWDTRTEKTKMEDAKALKESVQMMGAEIDTLQAELKKTKSTLKAVEGRNEIMDEILPPLEETRREMKALLLDMKAAMLGTAIPQRRKCDAEVPQWLASNSWTAVQSVPWNVDAKRVMFPAEAVLWLDATLREEKKTTQRLRQEATQHVARGDGLASEVARLKELLRIELKETSSGGGWGSEWDTLGAKHP